MVVRLWLRFIFIALLGSPFFFTYRGEAAEITKINLMPHPMSLKRINVGQRAPASLSPAKEEASKSFPNLEFKNTVYSPAKDNDYSLQPWQGQLIEMRSPRSDKSSGSGEYWFATLSHF